MSENILEFIIYIHLHLKFSKLFVQKIFFGMIKCQSGRFNTSQPRNCKVSFLLEEPYFDLILFTYEVIITENMKENMRFQYVKQELYLRCIKDFTFVDNLQWVNQDGGNVKKMFSYGKCNPSCCCCI